MDPIATDRNDTLADFVDEALESLRGLPSQLDAYRQAPDQTEPINAVFRAIHSIKGCAAFLDLDAIRTFSHALEDVLDTVRTGATSLDEALQRRLIEGVDQLDAMLQDVSAGKIAAELSPEQTQILEAVRSAAGACRAAGPPEQVFLQDLLRLADQMAAGATDGRYWSQKLRGLVVGRQGAAAQQPASASPPAKPTVSEFRGVRFASGEVDLTDRVAALLPFFEDFAEGRNSEEAERAFLRNLQDFAGWARGEGQAELGQALQDAAADFRLVHESPLDFDDNLVSLIWDHLWPALEKIKVHAREAHAAPDRPSPAQDRPKADAKCAEHDGKSRFVRVKEEYLDSFLEYVSRLFISSERFRDVQARMAETGQLPAMVDELREITLDLKVQSTALQQGVLALRRVSVSGLFSKFPRMARTLAGQLGKQINVQVVGEETEIDKQLSEDLDAPLMHLVRNVVDHGIEPPETRKACGKSEIGNLSLEARNARNHVVILVRDDGRGMDPGRLRAKALEKGILSPAEAAALSDQESLQLIFHPGFSTAEKVSEVSGRGVGMDVVRTTVQQHGGQVYVESQPGQGTTIRLEVPIRQATLVIDGLMVAEGGDQFVVPFENIREVVQLAASQFTSVQGRPVVTVRGDTYVASRLGKLLGLAGGESQEYAAETAILVQCNQVRLCLRVDRIIGHRQVVVTELKETLPDSTKLVGIAQLGGGRLAPVLSIPEIIKSLRESAML
jgi:two-component system chemotaxis sensor kinase CheA